MTSFRASTIRPTDTTTATAMAVRTSLAAVVSSRLTRRHFERPGASSPRARPAASATRTTPICSAENSGTRRGSGGLAKEKT